MADRPRDSKMAASDGNPVMWQSVSTTEEALAKELASCIGATVDGGPVAFLECLAATLASGTPVRDVPTSVNDAVERALKEVPLVRSADLSAPFAQRQQ